ncbi:hypothetical protein G6F70_008437 [Rhizopus microsporus]|nr:hypothetical protein G6F71_008436 [Rhizopus microsporus]RCH85752.1 hypothetical protein CU097_009046 [Rhizopus azygosporus]KAG1195171.1 hypothetical protein G6F70_008437 [Rhizopus microsporus]KAG1207009.1 hypothetical protein G6F69_008391 [Rhizopus microsporus]KAG1227616.1 hypothetical protein G6F67_008339 [Rhizopus microsporus]
MILSLWTERWKNKYIDLLKIVLYCLSRFGQRLLTECWGGTTFDVAIRFLHEDRRDRLAALRKLVPNVPFQMLLRGTNAVEYISYSDNFVYELCDKAVKCDVYVFRIFDSLSYVENMKF